MSLSFFSSPEGVAIAWVCTVFGVIFAILQTNKVFKLKREINSLDLSNSKLRIENNNLEQKIVSFEKNEIRDNYQEVKQTGRNNINQGVVSGDVNLDLS